MRQMLAAAGALLLPCAAAAGVGSTVPLQRDLLGALLDLGDFTRGDAVPSLSPGFSYPSLDIRLDEVVIQIHVIETLVIVADQEMYLGGNAWVAPLVAPVSGSWSLFGGIGGSLDLLTFADDLGFAVGPVLPVGVRVGDGARVAIYAMPGVSLAAVGGETDLVGEGLLVGSVWF